ncbi:MAG TPA: hypothetical protein VN946_11140 [Terriglobales bacterium]|jgi:hypothetical protein|nr:hypothetical protein [Terriglobales bacterium]
MGGALHLAMRIRRRFVASAEVNLNDYPARRFLDSTTSDRDFTGKDEEPLQLRARGNSDDCGQSDSHPER